jgi:hypothetical protein
MMAVTYQGTPHHKAKNVKLTDIGRLTKNNPSGGKVEDDDDRNFVISRKVQPYYGMWLKAQKKNK